MPGLSETLSRLSALRGMSPGGVPGGDSRLFQLTFGPNPGALDARYFAPDNLPPGAPLVVVLHGCTQDPASYDACAGWSRLAERSGFAVLYPQQRRENNANLCFNWFSPADAARGGGEALSIKSMIDTMVADHHLDPSRVFITGLSAGGAMTGVMLATYPELFAGGAIIAGVPFGVAHSVPEAFEAMRGTRRSSRRALGDVVRQASSAKAWPRVSVWQGSADHTVAPANADAIVSQWLEVQNLPDAPSLSETAGAKTRRLWTDGDGRPLVESIVIAGMGHGTPVAAGGNGDEVAGPFMLDVGVSSTVHCALSWQIATPEQVNASGPAEPAPSEPLKPFTFVPPRGETFRAVPPLRPGGIDVAKVINDALRSAGLLR